MGGRSPPPMRPRGRASAVAAGDRESGGEGKRGELGGGRIIKKKKKKEDAGTRRVEEKAVVADPSERLTTAREQGWRTDVSVGEVSSSSVLLGLRRVGMSRMGY